MAPDRVVLTDFGIAQAAGTAELTVADVLIGSPSYIAPERDGDAIASLAAAVAEEPAPARYAGPLLWPVISGLLRKDPGLRLDGAAAERMLGLAAAPVGAVAGRGRAPGPDPALLSAVTGNGRPLVFAG
jgi:hypothetical protein